MAQLAGAPSRTQRKRIGMGEEARRNERGFTEGGTEGYGVCADEGRIEGELKQKLMELRG